MELQNLGLWRMLDANFNRCGEGLRVVEDWVRFVLNHAGLAGRLKQLRHELHQLGEQWPMEPRLRARDADGDVGRQIQIPSEYQRSQDRDLVQANLYRASQGLRVLEEVSKALGLESASGVEQLRYQVYQLQRDILLLTPSSIGWERAESTAQKYSEVRVRSWEKSGSQRLELLERATLYVLVDGGPSLAAYQEHVQSLAAAGVDVIQFRDKRLSDQAVWEYAAWTAEFLGPTQTLFVVNDRCDMAVAAGADGVHLGQDELPISVARSLVGGHRLIGLSTHDANQVQAAHRTSANYLGLGPVFPSKTKAFSHWVGLETLAACLPWLERPTFAIGGIDLTNQHLVRQAGFQRVAVQSALAAGVEIVPAVAQWRASETAATEMGGQSN